MASSSEVTVRVRVRLSLWGAIKLRIAGASYIDGYLRGLLGDGELIRPGVDEEEGGLS